MAVNNEYVNRVDANGQTLIDLTNDTATAGDVLEGRTLHLASGAPATGTYRPSDEIEAYLEATVGHSSKNLFKPSYRQGTVGNTTTTSSVCCKIVINTTNGATHRFKCFDNSFAFRVYGLTEAGKQQLLSGDSVSGANRPFDSNYIFSDTYEHTNNNSNIVAYAIMLRKTSTPGQEVWIDITPSDVPNNIFIVVESPLTIDTFEPYVTPTDEKKQDKPVVLWAWDSANPVQTVSLSALSDSILNYSIIKIFFNWRSIFSCIEGDAEILYGTEIPRAYFGTTLYDVDPSFSSASISLDCPQTAINLYAHRIGDGADLTHNCAIVKIIGIP